MPPIHKNIPEEQISAAINSAINDTSINDDEIEKYHEAAMDYLMGNTQTKTAANQHGVDLGQLEMLIAITNKKLVGSGSQTAKEAQLQDNTNTNAKMKESQNENKEVKDKQKSNTKRKREPSKRKNNKEETATNSKPAAATTRKKRRTTEDILHEEAREHVFKGNDPKDVDSEAVALLCGDDNNKSVESSEKEKNEELIEEKMAKIQQKTINTRSRTLLNKHQRQNNEQSGTGSSELSNRRRQSSPPESSSSSSSMALAIYKQAAPRASQGDTSLALALIKKTPNSQNQSQNNTNHLNNSSAKSRLILFNPRWKQFTKVMEDVVDEVLTSMNARNEEDKKRKTNMKAGIIDVFITQITIHKASTERNVGLSTIRRYCKDSKTRLEEYLGNETFANKPNFFHQFDNKDKSKVTLEQFRAAMEKAGLNVPPEIIEKKPRRSLKSNNKFSNASPTKRQSSSNVTTRAKNNKNSGQKHRASFGSAGANPEIAAGAGTSQNAQNAGNQFTIQNLKNDGAQNQILLTQQNNERYKLRGTPAQLRETIHQYFIGKYQGDAKQLANFLTNHILLDDQFRKINMPIELVKSAYGLLGRQYRIEDVEVLSDDEN